MQNTTKGIYFPNLNGVRFIAALSVMMFHYFGLPISFGHLGVVLFFVLSGFLITYLLIEEKEKYRSISIKNFYIRRILRIWPLYFLIVGIASLLFFVLKSNETDVSEFYNSILYYIFFIPNIGFAIFNTLEYAAILWSVGSEEQFYFVWPWILKIKNNKVIVLILIFIILFFSLGPHVFDYINNVYFENSIQIIFYFNRILYFMSFNSMATGGLLAFIYKYYPQYIKFLFNKILQFISLITLLYCWIFDINFMINDQFFATLFGILILNLALNPNVIVTLENKLFNYFGKISFGMYVYHFMAFNLNTFIITKILHLPFHNNIPYFLLGIIMTVLMASASYYFIEKPFLNLKQRKFTRVRSGESN